MTFLPTKQQLDELGFQTLWESFFIQRDEETSAIVYRNWNFYVFPQSIEDIQTLIRLLSPNN